MVEGHRDPEGRSGAIWRNYDSYFGEQSLRSNAAAARGTRTHRAAHLHFESDCTNIRHYDLASTRLRGVWKKVSCALCAGRLAFPAAGFPSGQLDLLEAYAAGDHGGCRSRESAQFDG